MIIALNEVKILKILQGNFFTDFEIYYCEVKFIDTKLKNIQILFYYYHSGH